MESKESISAVGKSRTLYDAQLLKGGAEYDEDGNHLEATSDQIKGFHAEMEAGLSERIKAVEETERAERITQLKERKAALEASLAKIEEELATLGEIKSKLDPRLAELIQNNEVEKITLEIGGVPELQLEAALVNANRKIYDRALTILRSKAFSVEADPKSLKIAEFSVAHLFQDEEKHSIEEIFQRASELGLELCPTEVGPHLRLKNNILDRKYIAMKPIPGVYNGTGPAIFSLGRDPDGRPENAGYPFLTTHWVDKSPMTSDTLFVFRLPE